jgi:hypothetical protein
MRSLSSVYPKPYLDDRKALKTGILKEGATKVQTYEMPKIYLIAM